MQPPFSLPPRYRWLGLALLLPSLALGIASMYFDFKWAWLKYGGHKGFFFAGNQNLTDELALTGCIVGLLLLSFAKTAQEDEYIQQLRLRAWQWAVLTHFALLLVGIWTVYDSRFLYFMVYNMLTVLVIFLLRFYWLLYKNRLTTD
jgi:hypothetical protein